jgi:CRP-like cAMP-binding protein
VAIILPKTAINKNSSMLDTLPKAGLFRGLAADQYREVIGSGIKTQLPPHEMLFQQGEPATHCYLVNRSRLKLTKFNEQGKEVIIRYVGPGELTAAAAVLRNGTFPVSAESVQETEIIGWDHRTMMALMHRFPAMATNLLKIVLLRIDDLQQRYLEVCTEQVGQRIARSLLRLMRWAGAKQGDGILIDFPLSRQNIADYYGITLYTVNRTLIACEKN